MFKTYVFTIINVVTALDLTCLSTASSFQSATCCEDSRSDSDIILTLPALSTVDEVMLYLTEPDQTAVGTSPGQYRHPLQCNICNYTTANKTVFLSDSMFGTARPFNDPIGWNGQPYNMSLIDRIGDYKSGQGYVLAARGGARMRMLVKLLLQDEKNTDSNNAIFYDTPARIIVNIGTNEIAGGGTQYPDTITSGMQLIVSLIRRRFATVPIYLMWPGIKPGGGNNIVIDDGKCNRKSGMEPFEWTEDKSMALKDSLAKHYESDNTVVVLDYHTLSCGWYKAGEYSRFADGAHWGTTGWIGVMDWLYDAIKTHEP